jgi:hypothetical protein
MERGSRVLNIMGEMEPLPPEGYEDFQNKEPYTS